MNTEIYTIIFLFLLYTVIIDSKKLSLYVHYIIYEFYFRIIKKYLLKRTDARSPCPSLLKKKNDHMK